MKVAIIGSRGIAALDLAPFVPEGTTEILSGGALGVDALAAAFAEARGLPLRTFLPEYARFGSTAPLVRDDQIAAECERMIAFWDGESRGTAYTVARAKERGKPVQVYYVARDGGITPLAE